MRTLFPTSIAGAATAALLLFSQTASAQEETAKKKLQLEEVVVTAQKRAESLGDVPVSVTALAGDKLADAGIVDLSALSEYTPNFKMVEGGLIPNVYMRGVGSGSNQGFELSVGIFSDGVHLGRPHQTRAAFLDLERLEVLRGPQSILFGKNAIAGALSLVSARPGEELEWSISGQKGIVEDSSEITGMISTPITDTFGVRLALRQREFEGTMYNNVQQRNEPGVDEVAGRLLFAWDPGDWMQSTLKLEGSKRQQHGRELETTHASALTTCSGEDVRHNSIRETDAREEAVIDSYNATLNLDFPFEAGTLTSVTAFSGFDSEDIFDADSSTWNTSTFLNLEKYDQISQEFRWTSPTGGFFEYITGIFYQTGETSYNETADLRVRNAALQDAPGTLADPDGCAIDTAILVEADLERQFGLDGDAWSVFAQFTFNLTERLRSTVGLRYVKENKEGFRNFYIYQVGTTDPDPVAENILDALAIDTHELEGDRSVGVLLPSVNFQWDVTDDIMSYITLTRGAKSGSFDARGLNARDGELGGGTNYEFEDEIADALEIGAKMRLLDEYRRLLR